MKKYLLLPILALLLTACGNAEEKEADKQVNVSSETPKLTDEERHEKIRNGAKEYSFVQINGDEVKIDESIKLAGEVTNISKEGVLGEFTLTSDEGDGFGIYSINNMLGSEVKVGDQITVYGEYAGKNDAGMPAINSLLVE